MNDRLLDDMIDFITSLIPAILKPLESIPNLAQQQTLAQFLARK
jgi:hypothetical protein